MGNTSAVTCFATLVYCYCDSYKLAGQTNCVLSDCATHTHLFMQVPDCHSTAETLCITAGYDAILDNCPVHMLACVLVW